MRNRFLQAYQPHLLRLPVFKVDQHRCRILGQVIDPSFHQRTLFSLRGPSNSLALLIDHTFQLSRRVGARILKRAGDDAFFADHQLHEHRRIGP